MCWGILSYSLFVRDDELAMLIQPVNQYNRDSWYNNWRVEGRCISCGEGGAAAAAADDDLLHLAFGGLSRC